MTIIYSVFHVFQATELYCDHNSNFKEYWSSVDKIFFSFFCLCVCDSTKHCGNFSNKLTWSYVVGSITGKRLQASWPVYTLIRTLLPFTVGEFWEESLVNTEKLSWEENFTFLYVEWSLIYVLRRGQMISRSTVWHDSTWNVLSFKMCPAL